MASGDDWSEAGLLAQQSRVFALVHDSVHAPGGSISSEHGKDQLKRDALVRYNGPVEFALMGSVKQALDAQDILNPGKALAVASA